MGYNNGTGPEGSPNFNNTPQLTSDLSRLRDFTIERGNVRKGLAADLSALTVVDGQMFVNKSDGFLYAAILGAYFPIAGKPIAGSLGHSPGVSPSASVEFLRRDHNGFVELFWSGTYTNPLANGSVVGSLPAGFRPGATYEAAAVGSQGGGGPVIVTITAAGAITVFIDSALSIRKVSFLAKFPAAA